MSWYDDEEADGVGGAEWMHEEVIVRGPFSVAFKLTRTRHYDLLANMAKHLKVPADDSSEVTAKFLFHVYDIAAEAWHHGRWQSEAPYARGVIRQALTYLDDEEFYDLLCDFRLNRKLTASVTPDTYRSEMDKAFAARVAKGLVSLMRAAQRSTGQRAA